MNIGSALRPVEMVRDTFYHKADWIDFNGDGEVDGIDLAQLLGSWYSTNAPTYDLDGSGKVDGGDLTILLAAWTG